MEHKWRKNPISLQLHKQQQQQLFCCCILMVIMWPAPYWWYTQRLCPVSSSWLPNNPSSGVSECRILHNVWLCVSYCIGPLLNMHSVCSVGHLFHSGCVSDILKRTVYLRPSLWVSDLCILRASCTYFSTTHTFFSNSCLHRVVYCKEQQQFFRARLDQWLPNVDLPTPPPSLLNHEAILDRNKSKKQCIRL